MEVVLLNVTGVPALGVPSHVKVASIAATTVTSRVTDAGPLLSVTVRRTTYVPAAAKTCVGFASGDKALLSPKSQLTVWSAARPVEVLAKVTALPATAGDETVNARTGGGTATVMVTVSVVDPVTLAMVSRTT